MQAGCPSFIYRSESVKNKSEIVLRKWDLDLLFDLRNGADIGGYAEAKRLRELQADAEYSGLFEITKAMGNYTVIDKHPYFGAILTPQGRAFLRKNGYRIGKAA
jgi:hypothetical protein